MNTSIKTATLGVTALAAVTLTGCAPSGSADDRGRGDDRGQIAEAMQDRMRDRVEERRNDRQQERRDDRRERLRDEIADRRGDGGPGGPMGGPLEFDDFEASDALAAELLSMIEEEKLAHDVYVALGEEWDEPVFTRIAVAESRHQDAVEALLDAAGLDDPRLEPGEFADAELQALYDELVAQGGESWSEAVAVGITIEERDIADLEELLAADDLPDDVRRVFERLLAGSERHLDAFERQL